MTTLGWFFPEEVEGVNHLVPQNTKMVIGMVIGKVVEHDLDIGKQAVLEIPHEPRPVQRIPHGLEFK